jgi:hypothetical protein
MTQQFIMSVILTTDNKGQPILTVFELRNWNFAIKQPSQTIATHLPSLKTLAQPFALAMPTVFFNNPSTLKFLI